MQEVQVGSLRWEDPLEEDMATHSSILPAESLWTEEPGGPTVHGVAEQSDATEHAQLYFCLYPRDFLQHSI